MKEFDVVTFGSAVKDVFLKTTGVPDKNGCFMYRIGAKVLIEEIRFDIGGGATNTATAFSRLGFKTGCICKVGSDNNSKEILDLLKKEKITFLGAKGKGTSGLSVVLNSRSRGRTILAHKGESNKLTLTDIQPFKTKWLYVSSMLGKSFETQKKLIKKLQKENVKIAFNPSSYLIKAKNIRAILKQTEILIINKEEAQDILNLYNKGKKELKQLQELGPKTVVITDKNNPIICYHEGKKCTLKPHKSIKVIERTGAGDAFASGFVAGRIKNWPIEACLKLALQEGESVLGKFGAKNDLLRRNIA